MWNTDFIIVCQNWIGPYSWIWIQFLFSAFIWLGFFYLESIAEFLRWLAFEKKAISILAENLNSGGNYLFTVVQMPDEAFFFKLGQFCRLVEYILGFPSNQFYFCEKTLIGTASKFHIGDPQFTCFCYQKRFKKIAWIQSHHPHLRRKFKLWAGKAKHCWFLKQNVCWQHPTIFCLHASSKLSWP